MTKIKESEPQTTKLDTGSSYITKTDKPYNPKKGVPTAVNDVGGKVEAGKLPKDEVKSEKEPEKPLIGKTIGRLREQN